MKSTPVRSVAMNALRAKRSSFALWRVAGCAGPSCEPGAIVFLPLGWGQPTLRPGDMRRAQARASASPVALAWEARAAAGDRSPCPLAISRDVSLAKVAKSVAD
jgi:hypothetical protein